MSYIFNYLGKCWNYIVHHYWSKDILRANILYVFLVLIYEMVHFSLKPIHWTTFNKVFWLMNLCLFFKLGLDIFDRYLHMRQR